ncbi:hypothetical protein LR002_02085 [Candidatus Gracilibacteria bacterium]|nr:hypothetical protein [Candidatus Gracilibacteria bacterium]
MKILKKFFLLTVIFSLFSLSACEKISNPFHKLSEGDKKISAEFLEEQTYQGHIDLSNLGLTKIPDFTKFLSGTGADAITSISLNANKITEIDGEKFKNFLNLKELDLSFNQIKNTEGIEKIPSRILGKLDLTKAGIEEIDGIGELTSLQELHLNFNKIKKVDGLENLKNLKYLGLARNQLTNIDKLSALNNLDTLKIEFNQVENIDKILNNEKSKLQMFTIKFNKINPEIVKAVEENNQRVYKMRHPQGNGDLQKINTEKK